MASIYYPPPAFAFTVGIASAPTMPTTANIDAAFQEVSGIDPKVDLEEVREGGVNGYVHQLPGVTKHSNLTLKRGFVTQASPFADWAAQSVGSTLGTPIKTQTINVFLLGPNQQALVTWTFLNAWPIKWEIGSLDASNSSSVLTQTLEISYSTVTSKLGGSGS